jgi:hypothetical protein
MFFGSLRSSVPGTLWASVTDVTPKEQSERTQRAGLEIFFRVLAAPFGHKYIAANFFERRQVEQVFVLCAEYSVYPGIKSPKPALIRDVIQFRFSFPISKNLNMAVTLRQQNRFALVGHWKSA